uniref:LRAT domain-containing protein n=1 Tax=Acrobeloides nanus TaxID=290746 RepID=A0A914CF68_9BILA
MMKGGIFGNLRNLEIDHYGIYVGDGKVVHNKPGVGWMLATGGGVELCSFEEFTGLGDGDGHQWVKVFNAHDEECNLEAYFREFTIFEFIISTTVFCVFKMLA